MQKAIIVGASSGIGKALATLLVQNGYQVGITGRRTQHLESLKASATEQFIVSAFDCTTADNGKKLEALTAALGGLDLLIVSAGTGEINYKLDTSIEQQTNQLNVMAFTDIVDWGYRYFALQKHGHLVAITSIAGLRGGKAAPAYGASKAYQINYLEGLRQKAHNSGLAITITDIRPGFVDTDMAKGPGKFWVASPEKAAKQLYRHMLNKRSVAYVTHRWRLIAILLKLMPRWLFNRL